MRGRAHKLPDALGGAELSPMLDTRLRFLRRVVEAAIIVVGVALALAQFTSLDRLAAHRARLERDRRRGRRLRRAPGRWPTRSPGMVLAVTQPLRIGDLVTFEGETGTVEDVSLTYTWLRTGSDARLIIPNERLAAGVLRNDSIRSPTVALEVSAWLAPDADETAALAAVEALEETRDARIAEVTDTGHAPAGRRRRRCAPPSASRAKASCGQRSCGHCARQGVGDPATNPDLPFQGS